MFVVDHEGDYTYMPIKEGAKQYSRLPAGAYKAAMSAQGVLFRPITVNQDGLIKMNTKVAAEVWGEVKSFFDQETRKRLAAAEVKNRRGIILHGIPGTGKTSLVRSLFPYMIEQGAVIIVDCNADRLEHGFLPAIHLDDPDRDVVLFFDEFDRNAKYSEVELKRLLDGLSSPNNILTIGCTNHLNNIPDALWKRPSRFSLVREMPAPSPEVRTIFLHKKFPGIPTDVALDLIGMVGDKSIDYVQEVCTLYLRGMDVDEIRDRITGVQPSALVMADTPSKDDDD
jgi:SpoVK/Ycf46/Vps4 family AAA+-type ATPase